jgi:hypothetical protein
MTQGVELFRHH